MEWRVISVGARGRKTSRGSSERRMSSDAKCRHPGDQAQGRPVCAARQSTARQSFCPEIRVWITGQARRVTRPIRREMERRTAVEPTEEQRRIYRREGEGYPSDLRDAEWARLAPLIPPARPGGRPRKTDMRAATNAIL
jgi:hypothetical protein